MVIRKKKVDEDWKEAAAREKEKIEQEEEARRRALLGLDDASDSGEVPEGAVSLVPIFEQLASQAMAGLGQMPDPRTGMRGLDLNLAQSAIDMLSSMDAKTRGRLDEEEASVLAEILNALRSTFVQVQQHLDARDAAQSAGDPPGESPSSGAPSPGAPG